MPKGCVSFLTKLFILRSLSFYIFWRYLQILKKHSVRWNVEKRGQSLLINVHKCWHLFISAMQKEFTGPTQSDIPNSCQTRRSLFTCLIVGKKEKYSELWHVYRFFFLQGLFNVTQILWVVEPIWREKCSLNCIWLGISGSRTKLHIQCN